MPQTILSFAGRLDINPLISMLTVVDCKRVKFSTPARSGPDMYEVFRLLVLRR